MEGKLVTEFIFGDTDGLLQDSDIQISGLFRIYGTT